ncbi:MAG: nucleotidyltransferase family protein [Pseudomonadota bacterium]|nr:nucleotidyltransferase family protein [Pseudomonadota bacterium]
MTPEFNLLCQLCQPPSPDRSALHAAQLISQLDDWTPVVGRAIEHELLPLFGQTLLREHAASLPPDLHAALQVRLERGCEAAMALTNALHNLLDCCERQGIEVAPFKGPLLAQRAYQNPLSREFHDLDLLVRHQDLERLLNALTDLGYTHPPDLSANQRRALAGYAGQYILFSPDGQVSVEPHWWLAPNTLAVDLDYRRIWSRVRRGRFQHREVLELAPEDTVLMLCIHGGKEQWPVLKQVVDLVWYLSSVPTLDWPSLQRDAEAWGIARMLRVGLLLAKRITPATVPERVRAWIVQDARALALADVLWRRLDGGVQLPNPYRLDRYYRAIRERGGDRLRYLWRTLSTPRAVHVGLLDLPLSLHWLYSSVKIIHDGLALPLWKLLRQVSEVIGSQPKIAPKKHP